MIKQLITTEIRQRQTISVQVYNSLKVLQMNGIELDEYIKDAVLDNPVLETDESSRDSDIQSLDAMKEYAMWAYNQPVNYSGNDPDSDSGEFRMEQSVPDFGESLREHLESQFDCSITDEEYRLLSGIIDYLDPCGYLTATDAELARVTGFSEEIVGYGISYIQMLDPLGVGARNLGECLCIQLAMLGYTDEPIRKIACEYLEDMAAGRYNKIARGTGVSAQEARKLCGIIRTLNPKPASSFGAIPTAPIVPDIYIVLENGVPVAHINESGTANLYINSYYVKLSKQDSYGEAAGYLNEKLSQAKWLIDAIASRKKTLRSILDLITSYQGAFFTDANAQPRPLTLKQVAQTLGLHESTISRAISGKYLQCDRGAFALKYFFAAKGGSGSTAGGVAVSRNEVMARIAELIAQEDKRAPLSDSRITEILTTEGTELSRRVVAKYRGQLGIAGTSVRRQV